MPLEASRQETALAQRASRMLLQYSTIVVPEPFSPALKLDTAQPSSPHNITPPGPASGAGRSVHPDLLFILILAGYFLAHVVIRLSVAGSLDLDEAEQVFEAQEVLLGYGTQPPLYYWLQAAVFKVFGVNLFAIAGLKNLLLFGTYLGLFLTARRLVGASAAMAVSASLLLIPQIGWESQRDLSHSVLLTMLACGTLWSYFLLRERGTPARYALFGLLVGLGLQSKYNFALFAGGLTLASLLVGAERRLIWNRKVWIAAAVAALCFLPHGLWLVNHLGAAAGGSLEKMSEGARQANYLRNVLSGLGSLALSSVAFVTPLWLVWLLACVGFRKQARIVAGSEPARLFLCLYAIFFGALVAMVLTGKVGYIKDRWLQPLLFSVPLLVFLVLPGLVQPIVIRRILRAAGAAAAIILLAMPLRVYLAPAMGRIVRAQHPYPQLAEEIGRQFPDVRVVLTDGKLVAGNLHFYRPQVRTGLLEQDIRQPQPLRDNILLIMPEGAPPGWLQAFAAAHPEGEVERQGRIRLPYRYGGHNFMSFEYAHIVARSK